MRYFVLIILGAFLALTSCKGGDTSGKADINSGYGGMDYASMIRMFDTDDGWTKVEIVNPWDTTALLQTLALIPSEINPDSIEIPSNAIIVNTPLTRSVVTSSVHIGLLDELGALGQISGVTDIPYIKTDSILKRIDEGKVVDCGAWMAPDVEKVIKLKPDAIIISPYQDGGNYARLTELGIPVVYAADYMENSPLGRSEWMKFYGRLYGHTEKSDSLFKAVESRYLGLKHMADSASEKEGKPVVMLDTPYMGLWYVHGKGSANDTFINDAGAENPFSYVEHGNSVGISPERFMLTAQNADVWVVRYNSAQPLTLAGMKADNPLYSRFRSLREGNIWACNTNYSPFYDETPFHPEYLLEDLIKIFHPSVLKANNFRYFSKLK